MNSLIVCDCGNIIRLKIEGAKSHHGAVSIVCKDCKKVHGVQVI